MDFIERFFGISPDGGDGSLEILLLVLLVLITTAIGMHFPHRRKKTDELRKQRRYRTEKCPLLAQSRHGFLQCTCPLLLWRRLSRTIPARAKSVSKIQKVVMLEQSLDWKILSRGYRDKKQVRKRLIPNYRAVSLS